MKILISNDDGYDYNGLKSLVKVMKPFGDIVVVAPKYHQSGMSMAVSMGLKPIAVKKYKVEPGVEWWYVDATPSSCVKWGLDEVFAGSQPDILVSGINHGANTASAELYSGTLGAAKEGALAGILSIGVSLDNLTIDADFSVVEKLLPPIIEKLIASRTDRFGIFYNINFPDLPENEILGVRAARQGIEHWEKEFRPYDRSIFKRFGITPEKMGILGFPKVEEGESIHMMLGELTGDPRNDETCDNVLLEKGWITVSAHNIDSTDYEEYKRLGTIFSK